MTRWNNLRRGFSLQCLALFISGALMALAMPPFNIVPTLLPGLYLLYNVLHSIPGWRSFVAGWVFGFGYFLAGLFWIGNALLVPGNEFKWVWPLAIVGLPIGLAIFTGAAGWLIARYADLKSFRGYIAFASILLLSEWLRGTILTGFPWNLYGYAWSSILPIVQSVSVFGVYGLTLLTILLVTLPAYLRLSEKTMRMQIACIVVAGCLVGIMYGGGYARLNRNATDFRDDVAVRLVQPNIPQQDKWNSDKLAYNLQKTVGLSANELIPGKKTVIVWPETAISDFILNDPNASEYLREMLFPPGSTALLATGVLRHVASGEEENYYNSLGIYDSSLRLLAAYDKAHLVPFGEYIPFQDIIPMNPFVNFSGFTPGKGIETITAGNLPPFSALVCYEVIFPGKVALKTSRPEWLINVTNDGWYGDSPGPYQHLAITKYRAVEEGVPLIRSANTGISAVFDPFGREILKFGYGQAASGDISLPSPASQTLYSKTGNYPLVIILFLVLLMCIKHRF